MNTTIEPRCAPWHMLTPLPSQEYLRECFDYDPNTGLLTWRVRPLAHFHGIRPRNTHSRWNNQFAGHEFGSIYTNPRTGYRCRHGTLDGKRYRTHRIIYKWATGEELLQIDHQDLDGTNNRWSNLRGATYSQNAHNVAVRPTNQVGIKGVKRRGHRSGYEARIRVNKAEIFLGYFRTIEEAQAAYAAAASKYYGEFARTD
jgi:HNH endonuclease